MMDYTLEPLQPFGVLIRNKTGEPTVEQFSPEQLREWVSRYKLVVFRGFGTLEKQALALFGQKLGKPLQWVFGAVNELKVKKDAENYIFTDHAVPMHWDGAFVGTIPHIILFQCIVAPKKEDMGGTTFADTEQMLNDASPARLREWQSITITYTTKKVVHYGGKITQPLVQPHEAEGKPVMRYAEPVDDLNPVWLEIKGLDGKEPERFIGEMQELLYDPRYLYTHRWEAGDTVLADNHTLLHGREAFRNPNERYIQRINILHRPPGFSLKRFLQNSLTIRRKEFFVAELPIFLIPLLLNLSAWPQLLLPTLWAGLLAIILLFNLGDMINCYADRRLDAIYKSHLSNAVYELGNRNVLLQIVLSGIGALLLTIIVALQTDRQYLIWLTLAGGFVGLQYSIPPLKFKSGGVLQLICLWGIIFFGPMLYTAIITAGFPGILQLFLFAAYGFHQMGIILLNTAEDYTEDKAVGLRTIIVSLGLHRSMNFAFWLVVVSGIGIQGGLAALFCRNGLPLPLYASIAVFTAGWIKILTEFRPIIRKVNGLPESDAINVIKKNGMKVPRWLKIGAYTALTVVTVHFLWSVFH